MKKEYNAEATEALKQLSTVTITSGGGCHSTDYSHETVQAWQDIRADSVERLVKTGADIYTKMPNGSRWIDNIIQIYNTPVLEKLIDIDAIDCKDDNIKEICYQLIRNHKTSDIIYTKTLGYKTKQQVEEDIKKYYPGETKDYGKFQVYGGCYLDPFDYRPIFEKLFQKGLKPNIKINQLHASLLLASAQRYEQFCDRCDGYCQTELMKLFIDRDVNPNTRDPITGDDTLMIMSRCGENSIVKPLLKKRVNPNHVNKNGDSALIQALERGHIETAILLIQNGAKLTYRYNGRTKNAITTFRIWYEKNRSASNYDEFYSLKELLLKERQKYIDQSRPATKPFTIITSNNQQIKTATQKKEQEIIPTNQ